MESFITCYCCGRQFLINENEFRSQFWNYQGIFCEDCHKIRIHNRKEFTEKSREFRRLNKTHLNREFIAIKKEFRETEEGK